MATIPNDVQTFNDGDVIDTSSVSEAVLQKIGACINGLNFKLVKPKVSVFTSNGTFLLPLTALPTVFIYAIGGGGVGGDGDRYGGTVQTGGGGGGGGIVCLRALTITPGIAYSVTIGQGGTRTPYSPSGKATVFGNNLASWMGGQTGETINVNNFRVLPNPFFFQSHGVGGHGGCPGQTGGINAGRGGAGLVPGPAPLTAAAANTGCGGSGGYGNGTDQQGKNGGSGLMIVFYFDIGL